jgi:hypothetical protein
MRDRMGGGRDIEGRWRDRVERMADRMWRVKDRGGVRNRMGSVGPEWEE